MARGKRKRSIKFERTPVDREGFSFERSYHRHQASSEASDAMRTIERIKQERRRRSMQIEDPPAPTPKPRRRD